MTISFLSLFYVLTALSEVSIKTDEILESHDNFINAIQKLIRRNYYQQ